MKDIITYNIYHYDDPENDNYYSYVIEEGNSVVSSDSNWKYHGTFYGINHKFYPVPNGMKLYSVEYANGFPYDITDMAKPFDIFERKGNNLYFNTYNMPAINTVILYSYKRNGHVYLTFSHIAPSFDPNWKIFMNLHVITPITVPDIDNTPFNCVNARCVPWPFDVPDIYQHDTNFIPRDLRYCVETCNTVNRPSKLIDEIQQDKLKILRSQLRSTPRECETNTEYNTGKGKFVLVGILFLIVILLIGHKILRYIKKKRLNKEL